MWGRREFVLCSVLLTAAVSLSACGHKREQFRYRMTVEVMTPQGLRSGSSVIEVDLSETGDNSSAPPEARGVRAKLHGQAVAVDLPDGKTLFALLRTPQNPDGAKWFAHDAIRAPHFNGEYSGIRRTEYMKEHKLSGELPRSSYPVLIAFKDVGDPTSIQHVNPDDLTPIFGEGVTVSYGDTCN